MIRFLRNIRRRLLSENRFSKYLLYASGEILLVVIGILIALSLNNWNEARQNRAKERVLLQKLHREFRQNLAVLEGIQERNLRRKEVLDSVVLHFQFPERNIAERLVGPDLILVFATETYDPARGTVESLIYSGDIGLIRNDSLRDMLTAWPYILQDYKEEEVFDLEGVTAFRTSFVEEGQLEDAWQPNPLRFLEVPKTQRIILLRQRAVTSMIDAVTSEGLLQCLETVISLTDSELAAEP